MKRRRGGLTRTLALGSALAAVIAFAGAAHAQTVVVRGDERCPSADMIRAALLAARPEGPQATEPVAVEVFADRISLGLGENGSVRREIPADGDCAVRAATVAVVIAAWSGELASHPSDSPLLTATSPALSPLPLARATSVFELDAAGFYSAAWGHAAGAWLGVGRTPRAGGLGVRALGAFQTSRELALEGGSNDVQRFLLGAAATYHLQRQRVFASGDLGLVGTLTRAEGAGYATNRSAMGTNFGGVADLRGGLRFGRFRVWANARFVQLVFAESVNVQSSSPGVADKATLSQWDLQLGVGLGYRFDEGPI